eukprot:m51a1_g7528 putative serine threonine protein kinase (615) ;mRNA; r:34429-36671
MPHDLALPAHGRAIAMHTAQSVSEVNLALGDFVIIVETRRAGNRVWCLVDLADGRRGYVPATALELLPQSAPPPPPLSALPPLPMSLQLAAQASALWSPNPSPRVSPYASPCESPSVSSPPVSGDARSINSGLAALSLGSVGSTGSFSVSSMQRKVASMSRLPVASTSSAPVPPASGDVPILQRTLHGSGAPAVALSALPASQFDFARELRACPPGGVVTVPAGVHLAQGPIKIARDVTVAGAGSATTAVAIVAPASSAAVSLGLQSRLALSRVTIGLGENSGDGAVLVSCAGVTSAVTMSDCAVVGSVWVRDGAVGTFERCDMRVPRGNVAAVVASAAAEVRASWCSVHDCSGGGFLASGGGSVTVLESEIHANRVAGAAAHEGGKLNLVRTRVRACAAPGVVFRMQSEGAVEDCDFENNRQGGVLIESGSKPAIRRCRISGGHAGIVAVLNAEGVVEDCDISSGDFAGVYVKTGAKPTFLRCTVRNGTGTGLSVHRDGAGVYDSCEIVGHALAGVSVETGGRPVLRRCRVHSGKAAGVMVTEGGNAILEDVDVYENESHAVHIAKGGQADLRRCRLRTGKFYVADEAAARIEACTNDGGTDFGQRANVQVVS